MANDQKVLLLEGIHAGAQQRFQEAGIETDILPGALPEAELIEKIQDYTVVGIRSKSQLKESVLSKSSHLNAIGAFCIGTNQIDLGYANSLGVPVFNAPYSNTRSVAELVISEMIALSRNLGDINSLAHKGQWNKSAKGNREVRGKTLGIVGYGHIGSQVSVLAEALGLNVIYYDILKKLPLGNATAMESMDELLEASDFVTLHVPETDLTRDMMGSGQMEKMKPGSYLINASRGTVVVIEDLVKFLKSGHIAGAAVDVFPKEPKNNQETFESPLCGLENVILTPHIGGSTEEAQVAIGLEVSESLVRYLQMGSTFGAVNFPQVEPGQKNEKAQRVLNVHKNVPGVMKEINSMVSNAGANIVSQHLSTDENIGYLVMDFESEGIVQLAKEIDSMDFSIKTRRI